MAILLLLITLTLSTTLDCPVVLSDGDESAAESIVDSLHAEDSTAHKEFRKFILFSKDFTAQEVPCETPTAQVTWLKSIANTDNEMAFAAEATLTAIDNKQLTPTPLRWIESDSKRLEQLEETTTNNGIKPWLYPVPTQNILNIDCEFEQGVFIIYDLHGRPILMKHITTGVSTVSLLGIPAGYYIGNLSSFGGESLHAPLIISR